MKEYEKLVNEFLKNGASHIEEFMSETYCDKLSEKIVSFVEKEIKLNSNIINSGNKIKNINKDPIINLRGSADYDQGFIDFINCDKKIELFSKFSKNKKILFIKTLLEKSLNKKFKILRCHSYINNSVLNTRDYHRDFVASENFQIKIFLYLTDVLSNEYGPYSYILKNGNRVDFLGKKGTMIISDQNGLHRGLPQSLGKSRVVAVINLVQEKI